MSIPSIKNHRPWLVPAAILLALVGVFVAQTVFAGIQSNTIDPVGTVDHRGRRVTVTGPLKFTAGESADLHVRVTQRTTGALAEGRAFLTGTGEFLHWEVETRTEGREDFEPGPATAVAFVRTTAGGKVTDSHQWLVNITLVRE